MPLTKADLKDVDIVDAYELKSDGRATTPSSVYLVTSGVSTTPGPSVSTVVSSMPSDGEGLLNSADHPVQAGDLLFITGSLPAGAADGRYVVSSVVDDVTVTVEGVVPSSTGGTLTWVYASGASEVGFDPTGQTVTAATDVNKAIVDIANAISDVPVPIRQYVRMSDGYGPFEEFVSDAYRELTTDPFPGVVNWYSDSLKTRKVAEKRILYNTNRTPSSITWSVFDTDSSTVVAFAQDLISYSGAFETSRSRYSAVEDKSVASDVLVRAQRTLRDLISFDDERGPFEKFIRTSGYSETSGGPFPTYICWWDSPAKSRKIVDETLTYSGSRPSSVVWQVYSSDGAAVLVTVNEQITYSGWFELSRKRQAVSTSYREITGGIFPTYSCWYDSPAKARKIVDKTMTYSGPLLSTITWKIYAEDGSTPLVTVVDTITYSSYWETSRTRTLA